MTLLMILNDFGNQVYFERRVGRGCDLEKFRFSVEPDEYSQICGECGKGEGDCRCGENRTVSEVEYEHV